MRASFGSQIRNYILFPYKLIKDIRTGIKSNKTIAILNGDINMFIIAFIVYQFV